MRNNKFGRLLLIIFAAFLSYYSWNNYLRPVKINDKINRESEHYIYDIYQSDGYRYSLLNEQEKEFYKDLIEGYKNLTKKKTFNLAEYGCSEVVGCNIGTSNIFNAIFIDHPELIQFSSFSYIYNNSSTVIKFDLMPITRFKFINFLRIKKMQRKVEDIRKETEGLNEREKVIYVYDWMGKNARYDYAFTYNSKNQSAYNSLIKGGGVCASFAKSAQILFQNIGIDSQIAIGSTGRGLHAWNIIKIDGNYYNFDSTYASSREPGTDSYYDGLIQSVLKGHKFDDPLKYPKLTNDDFFVLQ